MVHLPKCIFHEPKVKSYDALLSLLQCNLWVFMKSTRANCETGFIQSSFAAIARSSAACIFALFIFPLCPVNEQKARCRLLDVALATFKQMAVFQRTVQKSSMTVSYTQALRKEENECLCFSWNKITFASLLIESKPQSLILVKCMNIKHWCTFSAQIKCYNGW